MNAFKLLPLFILIDYAMSQSRQPIGVDYSISETDQEWLNSLFRLPDRPRIRKEYRMMADEERSNFHKAFHLLRNDTTDSGTKKLPVRDFAIVLRSYSWLLQRDHCHGGENPYFAVSSDVSGRLRLGDWKPDIITYQCYYPRYFFKKDHRFENALREMMPLVTIPYWDTTLDAELEQPRLSYLWSSEFLGNGDGFVTTGPFAGWKTQMGELYRTVGGKRWPIHKSNLTHIFNQRYLENINSPKISPDDPENRNIEEQHNLVHSWIGGEMSKIETSADDPVFFVLHAFIDCIWEEFRTTQKVNGIDPSLDFPVLYGDAKHNLFSPLGLGNVMTFDALSEAFARNIIYADRPTCTENNTSCDSAFLRCDRSKSVCVALTITEVEEIRTFATKTKLPFFDVAMEFEARLSKTTDTKEQDSLFTNITDEYSGKEIHTFPSKGNELVSDIERRIDNIKLKHEGKTKYEMTRTIQGATNEDSFLREQSSIQEILVSPSSLTGKVNVTKKPEANVYLDKIRYFNLKPIFIFYFSVSCLAFLVIILKVRECFIPQMKRMTPCSSIRKPCVGHERGLNIEALDEIDKSFDASYVFEKDEISKIYGIADISLSQPERGNRRDHVTIANSLSPYDREHIIQTIDHAFKGIFENDGLTGIQPSRSDEQIYREWRY